MREGSCNQFFLTDPPNGVQFEAKSLFRNILAVSPCGSRFYPDPARSPPRKLLRMNILGGLKKKMCEDQSSRSRQESMREFPLDATPAIRYHVWNKFALRSGPEFHAEWLRDEP